MNTVDICVVHRPHFYFSVFFNFANKIHSPFAALVGAGLSSTLRHRPVPVQLVRTQ